MNKIIESKKIKKGEATKKRILVEALTLYSIKGVQNTPFQEIADKIGITQAALYKYFSNRDELLKEAVLLSGEEGRAFFKLDPSREIEMSPREKLAHYLKVNVEWAHSGRPYNVAFLSLHYFASQISMIGEVHREVSQLRVQRILQILMDLKPEIPAKEINSLNAHAISIHNILLGEMLEAYNQSGVETIKARGERIYHNVLKILGMS